mmetsp:Transcript_35324/g.59544  ORF Transcript_35324/g.59544 Transcript_35324/m.59544 type:complete len:214 (-) Transcript_35324:334-975(-)
MGKRIHIKSIGRSAVQVEAPDDCTGSDLRKLAGKAAQLPAEQIQMVWKGRTIVDSDQPTFEDGETILVFVAPKPPSDSKKWAVQEEEDGDEALRVLRERVKRVAVQGWRGKCVSFLRNKCHCPDEFIGLLLSIRGWQWALFAVWSMLSRVAYVHELGPIYIIMTGFFLIFTNLGRRIEGEVSAYSVFNSDFRELPGNFNADRVDQHLRQGHMR